MSTIATILGYVYENRFAFSLASGWAAHCWHLAGGKRGIINFYETGSTTLTPENPAAPKDKP